MESSAGAVPLHRGLNLCILAAVGAEAALGTVHRAGLGEEEAHNIER